MVPRIVVLPWSRSTHVRDVWGQSGEEKKGFCEALKRASLVFTWKDPDDRVWERKTTVYRGTRILIPHANEARRSPTTLDLPFHPSLSSLLGHLLQIPRRGILPFHVLPHVRWDAKWVWARSVYGEKGGLTMRKIKDEKSSLHPTFRICAWESSNYNHYI